MTLPNTWKNDMVGVRWLPEEDPCQDAIIITNSFNRLLTAMCLKSAKERMKEGIFSNYKDAIAFEMGEIPFFAIYHDPEDCSDEYQEAWTELIENLWAEAV